MKFATITIFLAGLATAVLSASVADSPVTDAAVAKIENFLADRIRNMNTQLVVDEAVKSLQPAVVKMISDYALRLATAQRNAAVEVQRMKEIQKRYPQAASASAANPMAAASAELLKVSEDVGISIGTMIGTQIGGTIGRFIGSELSAGVTAIPGYLGITPAAPKAPAAKKLN